MLGVVALPAGDFEMFAVIERAANQPAVEDQRLLSFQSEPVPDPAKLSRDRLVRRGL